MQEQEIVAMPAFGGIIIILGVSLLADGFKLPGVIGIGLGALIIGAFVRSLIKK